MSRALICAAMVGKKTAVQTCEPEGSGPVVGGHTAAVAAAGLKQWFALRQTSSGDCTEEAAVTKTMLSEVYCRSFDDAEAVAVLPACPEVGWIVECHCRAPLPPGWRKSKVAPGDVPEYACDATGEVTETPPSFKYFVRLADLAIRVRLDDTVAEKAHVIARHILQDAKEQAQAEEKKWTGPHIDPGSQEGFYHNPATGESSWDSPADWAKFLICVGERLLHSEIFPLGTAEKLVTLSPKRKGATPDPQTATTVDEPKIAQADLPVSGDAWGALDALASMDESAATEENNDSWTDMEDWIASQAKKGTRDKGTPSMPPMVSGPRSPVGEASSSPPAFPSSLGSAGPIVPPLSLSSKTAKASRAAATPAPSGEASSTAATDPAPAAPEVAPTSAADADVAPAPPPTTATAVVATTAGSDHPAPPADSAAKGSAPRPSDAAAPAVVSRVPPPPAAVQKSLGKSITGGKGEGGYAAGDGKGSAGAAAGVAAVATKPVPTSAGKSQQAHSKSGYDDAGKSRQLPRAPPPTTTSAVAGHEPVQANVAPKASPAPMPVVNPVKVNGEEERLKLHELAKELRALAPEGEVSQDHVAVGRVLEAISKLPPATFEDLRDTKLGILTRPYKDSSDQQIRALAKRLRKSWKDLVNDAVEQKNG